MTSLKEYEDRFWTYVDRSGECWIWKAYCTKKGYGIFGFGGHGKTVRAHRFAYVVTYGSIPSGKKILHTCDNQPCVRPSHLFVGSQLENIIDREKKLRTARGSSLPNAKLRWDLIEGILERHRGRTATIKELAKEHDVSYNTMWRVIKGYGWNDPSKSRS